MIRYADRGTGLGRLATLYPAPATPTDVLTQLADGMRNAWHDRCIEAIRVAVIEKIDDKAQTRNDRRPDSHVIGTRIRNVKQLVVSSRTIVLDLG